MSLLSWRPSLKSGAEVLSPSTLFGRKLWCRSSQQEIGFPIWPTETFLLLTAVQVVSMETPKAVSNHKAKEKEWATAAERWKSARERKVETHILKGNKAAKNTQSQVSSSTRRRRSQFNKHTHTKVHKVEAQSETEIRSKRTGIRLPG